MRILAIDLGDARTGLALADDITRVATPLDLIEVPIHIAGGNKLLDALARAIDEHTRDTVLALGLPINMDDTEGPRALLVRDFAQRLADRVHRPIELVDERKTSQAADARMARSGLTHKQKKKRRDALAAAAIAESFLESPESRIDRVEPSD